MLPGIVHRFRKYYLPTVVRFSPLIEAESPCYRYYPEYVSPEDTVVEVGVFFGGGTRLLSKLARHVYSFEPHPLHYSVAKALISKGRADNVDLFDFGLGKYNGKAVLKVRSGGVSNIDASAVGVVGATYDSSVEVKMRRLDSLDIVPDVLIMDAEGSELDVIEGSGERLQRLSSAIIEAHPVSSGHTLSAVKAWADNHFEEVRTLNIGGPIPWVMARRRRQPPTVASV